MRSISSSVSACPLSASLLRRSAVTVVSAAAALSIATPALAVTTTPAATAPPVVSSLTMSGPTHPVPAGRHGELKLRLLTGNRPVRGATVTLLSWSGHAWHGYRALRTGVDGRVAFIPNVSADTAFIARFHGSSTVLKSQSAKVVRVNVLHRPAPVGVRALAVAASREGAPYVWGAAGPTSFDCSGLVMYSFRAAGRSLPHSAAAQYGVTRHLAANQVRPGDLLFFRSGGRITHVGIYAGAGRMVAAPHSGDVVRNQSVYDSSFLVGRVT